MAGRIEMGGRPGIGRAIFGKADVRHPSARVHLLHPDGINPLCHDFSHRMGDSLTRDLKKTNCKSCLRVVERGVVKADSLQVSIDPKHAKHLTNKYGAVGALPKNLDRDRRKQVYEARYVTGGGPQASAHQHRARIAGIAQHVSNAVAAGSAGTLLASRTSRGRAVGRRVRGVLAQVHPRIGRVTAHQVQHHAENTGLTGVLASVGAGAAQSHAKNRQRKASSMQAGVAAGALRRMQAYEPDRRAS